MYGQFGGQYVSDELESSYAVAHAIKLAKTKTKGDVIIINLSGRGDKDLDLILNSLN